jgi:catechol 2,3-dioxygenase-like lactoylglutathione lyase family enzyme
MAGRPVNVQPPAPKGVSVKIEHVAYQVEDPAAVARWYVEHLGMTIKRSFPQRPWGHFIADSSGTVMLELYSAPTVQVPDYRSMDPLLLHVAFSTDNVTKDRDRLIAVGATPVGEVTTNPQGDQLAMLRDPWGFAVQLVWRKERMI